MWLRCALQPLPDTYALADTMPEWCLQSRGNITQSGCEAIWREGLLGVVLLLFFLGRSYVATCCLRTVEELANSHLPTHTSRLTYMLRRRLSQREGENVRFLGQAPGRYSRCR